MKEGSRCHGGILTDQLSKATFLKGRILGKTILNKRVKLLDPKAFCYLRFASESTQKSLAQAAVTKLSSALLFPSLDFSAESGIGTVV
jgi:hypothetical protein